MKFGYGWLILSHDGTRAASIIEPPVPYSTGMWMMELMIHLQHSGEYEPLTWISPSNPIPVILHE